MAQCRSCGGAIPEGARFCSSCGSPVDETAHSPDQNPGSRKRTSNFAGKIFLALLLVFGLGFFVVYLVPSTNDVIRQQPVVAEGEDYGSVPVSMTTVPFSVRGNDLVFSLDDLKRHRLIRFEYSGSKTPRAIMAYVAPDGRLVTAISLSEHCGSTEFTIQDNEIHCSCGSRWDMMTMEAYACCAQYYPDPIPSRVVGNEVFVSRSVVEDWAGRL